METIEIDIISVVLASLVYMGIGMLWYSPSVFGKRWMKLTGMKAGDKPKDMGLTYSLMFFATLIASFTLEIFIANVPGANAATGIMAGFWAGIGFVATTSLPDYLFSPNAKHKELYFINTSYHVIAFMVMGLILGI